MRPRKDRNQDARALFDRLRENRSGRAAELTALLTAALATERRLMAQRIKPAVLLRASYYHGARGRDPILSASDVNRIVDEEAENQ